MAGTSGQSLSIGRFCPGLDSDVSDGLALRIGFVTERDLPVPGLVRVQSVTACDRAETLHFGDIETDYTL